MESNTEMQSDRSSIKAIMSWYRSQCNGDWEHQYGIKIDTLDNPGWCIEIDLRNTKKEDVEFPEVTENYEHETDWLITRKDGSVLRGSCGVGKLEDMLAICARWLDG